MAGAHFQGVSLPFAYRVLHPWLVNKLSSFVGIDNAFLFIGSFSLFIFLAVSLALFYKFSRLSILTGIGFIFIPSLFLAYRDLYIQTIFFIALTSIYWFMLINKKYLISSLILLVMLLTREEAVVICFSFMLALLISDNNRYKEINKGFYLFLTLGILVFWLGFMQFFITINANVNIYRMPSLFYLIFKVPVFALRNLLGFQHWVDTYKNLSGLGYTHDPWIVFNLSDWVSKFVNIKQVGIYGWNFYSISNTWIIILSIFGTAPTMLIYLLFNKGLKIKNNSIVFNTILFSGSISFILGPFVGTITYRHFINAWPVFFLTIPFLIKYIYSVNKPMFFKTMVTYLVCLWLPVLFYNQSHYLIHIGLIVVLLLLHIYTYLILKDFSIRDRSDDKLSERLILFNRQD